MRNAKMGLSEIIVVGCCWKVDMSDVYPGKCRTSPLVLSTVILVLG